MSARRSRSRREEGDGTRTAERRGHPLREAAAEPPRPVRCGGVPGALPPRPVQGAADVREGMLSQLAEVDQAVPHTPALRRRLPGELLRRERFELGAHLFPHLADRAPYLVHQLITRHRAPRSTGPESLRRPSSGTRGTSAGAVPRAPRDRRDRPSPAPPGVDDTRPGTRTLARWSERGGGSGVPGRRAGEAPRRPGTRSGPVRPSTRGRPLARSARVRHSPGGPVRPRGRSRCPPPFGTRKVI